MCVASVLCWLEGPVGDGGCTTIFKSGPPGAGGGKCRSGPSICVYWRTGTRCGDWTLQAGRQGRPYPFGACASENPRKSMALTELSFGNTVAAHIHKCRTDTSKGGVSTGANHVNTKKFGVSRRFSLMMPCAVAGMGQVLENMSPLPLEPPGRCFRLY